ncbi:carbohydrate esterase family 8 protein [Gonapodya prolifera JEL478]|uniref:pectinesterase n=1 Tax=Gonapodya prolifera (strain JEL478) TaxID=1344416 RepID=A0A138ZY40_GONPJ|nr:carbohydrate esterase family 8 protein [Gonapodya prolifera JEL478]|eukprot:KXS09416.1 carbohydrate esterase family 8 protein [Gonapodya prolifera JEL478]
MRTLSPTSYLISALALALAVCVAALQANVPSSAIIVAKDDSGNFTTLQAAVNSVKQPNTNEVIIYVKAGIYTEQVSIKSNFINIRITNNLDAKTWQVQNPVSTGASAESGTVKVRGDFFKVFDITFDFIWGQGRAIFQNSEFHVGRRPNGSTGNGYVTANGNNGASHKASWFLMLDSSISADRGMNALLGRAWGSIAAGTWQGV